MSQFLLGLASVLSFAQTQRKQEAKPKRQEQENKVAKLQAEIEVLERQLSEARSKLNEAIASRREAVAVIQNGKAAMLAALQSRVDAATAKSVAARAALDAAEGDLSVAKNQLIVKAGQLEDGADDLAAALEAWTPTTVSANEVVRVAALLAHSIALYLTECDAAPAAPGDAAAVSGKTLQSHEATLAEAAQEYKTAVDAWGTSDTSDEAVAVRAASDAIYLLVVAASSQSAEYRRVALLLWNLFDAAKVAESELVAAIEALAEVQAKGAPTAAIERKATNELNQLRRSMGVQTSSRNRAASRLKSLIMAEAGT